MLRGASQTMIRRQRRQLLVVFSAAVVTLLAGAVVWVRLARTRHSYAATCKHNLCYIYVVWHHVPRALADLPPDKRVAYSFCSGCRKWKASEEELAYLKGHGFWPPDWYGWHLPDIIYCYADPAHRDKIATVADMSIFTGAADIAPSSYVWLPDDQPNVLAACPYHNIAVRRDTGEIVPWDSY